MDEDKAQTFVDRQLDLNRDLVDTARMLHEALRRQAKVNQAAAEKLNDLENTIKTHRQLITGLTIGYFASTIGLIIWMMA
jgi:hypothetical protein